MYHPNFFRRDFQELFRYYKEVIALRGKCAALRHGSFHVLHTDDSAATLAFARILDRETLLVVINRGNEPGRVDLPRSLPSLSAGRRLKPLLVSTGDHSDLKISADGPTLQVTVPALSGGILQVTGAE